jgi:fructan beta-fructosidase
MLHHRKNTAIGQSLVEFGLILVLVVITALLILNTLGTDLKSVYCRVSSAFGSTSCEHLLSDDLSSLKGWQVVNGTWKTIAGRLTGGPSEGRVFKDLNASDYTINVKAANLKEGNGYGVFFRTSNPTQVNGYAFQYDPGLNGMVIRKWVNGNEINPAIAYAAAPSYDWYGQDKQIQITAQGSLITVKIDGKQVLTATDSTYASGGVGFRTWDSTSASFSGLTVDRTSP